MADSLLERCIRAAEVTAAACEMALAADVSYTSPGPEPYTKAHLALVSCASVCSLLVRALREGDDDLALVRWCAEICFQCAAAAPPDGLSETAWTPLVRACARCASDCERFAERFSSFPLHAFGASGDGRTSHP